uniref:exo-alpha-sialidase n=1 Tax=Persicitalea sp. TaxID=3100273 RepID=UPI00359308DB
MRKQLYLILLLVLTATAASRGQPELTPTPKISENLIFPVQKDHTHGSSLVELPNGDQLAAWFQGSGERNADDVRIMGARLKKGGKEWSKPFVMADTPHLPDCNPVLFLNHEKKLFMVWIAVQANRWEQSILRLRTSTDFSGEGAPVWNWQDNILLKPDSTFATEVEAKLNALPKHPIGWAEYAPRYDQMIAEAATDPTKRSIGWMTRIKPLLLDKQKIVLPLYSDGYNFS